MIECNWIFIFSSHLHIYFFPVSVTQVFFQALKYIAVIGQLWFRILKVNLKYTAPQEQLLHGLLWVAARRLHVCITDSKMEQADQVRAEREESTSATAPRSGLCSSHLSPGLPVLSGGSDWQTRRTLPSHWWQQYRRPLQQGGRWSCHWTQTCGFQNSVGLQFCSLSSRKKNFQDESGRGTKGSVRLPKVLRETELGCRKRQTAREAL